MLFQVIISLCAKFNANWLSRFCVKQKSICTYSQTFTFSILVEYIACPWCTANLIRNSWCVCMYILLREITIAYRHQRRLCIAIRIDRLNASCIRLLSLQPGQTVTIQLVKRIVAGIVMATKIYNYPKMLSKFNVWTLLETKLKISFSIRYITM